MVCVCVCVYGGVGGHGYVRVGVSVHGYACTGYHNRSRCNRYRIRLKKTEQQLAEEKSSSTRKDGEIERLSAQRDRLQEQLSQLRAEISDLKTEIEEVNRQHATARLVINPNNCARPRTAEAATRSLPVDIVPFAFLVAYILCFSSHVCT